MLSNNNTRRHKLVQAVELSDAEMEKISGGVEYSNSIGYQPSNGGYIGYGSAGDLGGYVGYQTNNGGYEGYIGVDNSGEF